MHQKCAITPDDRLILKSQLAELNRVWPWIESLAQKYSIPADTQFAIDLCLEEAISNVIRHGYASDPNQGVTVHCVPLQGSINFILEDSALPFDVCKSIETTPAVPASIDDITVGGNGIHLIQRFADSVVWEPLSNGNRLTLRFPLAPPEL